MRRDIFFDIVRRGLEAKWTWSLGDAHCAFGESFFFWLCWVFVDACGLFSSCSEQGLLFVVARGLLIAVASLIVEQGL